MEFQLQNEDAWNKCEKISRPGEITGKSKYLLNLSNYTIQLIDWSKKKCLICQKSKAIVKATQCSKQDILAEKIQEI